MVTLVRQSEQTCLSANEAMRLQPMDLLTSQVCMFCVHLSGPVMILQRTVFQMSSYPRAYVRIIYKKIKQEIL